MPAQALPPARRRRGRSRVGRLRFDFRSWLRRLKRRRRGRRRGGPAWTRRGARIARLVFGRVEQEGVLAHQAPAPRQLDEKLDERLADRCSVVTRTMRLPSRRSIAKRTEFSTESPMPAASKASSGAMRAERESSPGRSATISISALSGWPTENAR